MGVLVGTTGLLLVVTLVRTGGTFVYPLDDPAIHLTVARRLAYDGTWGIVPGEFQAASSSPLWTLLLAPTQWLFRGRVGELVPLALNLLAAAWILHLLRRDVGRVLGSSHRGGSGLVDLLAVGVLVVALLSLPRLAFLGMEHTLHMALVLATAVAVERAGAVLTDGQPSAGLRRGARAMGDASAQGDGAVGARGTAEEGRRGRGGMIGVALGLMFLATLARGESAFVAMGLAVAVLAVGVGVGVGGRRDEVEPVGHHHVLRARLLFGGALGAASAAALGVVAAANVAFGQRPLPNSVLAKTFADRGDTRRSLVGALDRLTTDPWLLALLVIAVIVLVVGRRGWCRQAVFPATVTLVTGLLHVELAAVAPDLRYEAYVVGLGVWMVLRVLGDLSALATTAGMGAAEVAASAGGTASVRNAGAERTDNPEDHRLVTDGPLGRRAGWRGVAGRVRPAVWVLLLVPLATLQVRATLTASGHAAGTFEQRYQVARFLHENYQHEPIAIGELGYIGLYHDGPLTDVYGLGDFEVLEAALAGDKDAAFWDQMQRQRGFRVVVAYDFAIGHHKPESWISVADWRSPDQYYETTRFWAASPEEVAHLRAQLEAYESRLPASVEVRYNELAPFLAAERLDR